MDNTKRSAQREREERVHPHYNKLAGTKDSILNDLGAMKDAWVDDQDQLDITLPPATTSYRPCLLGGLTEPPDRAAILASLPTRLEADRLIERCFQSYNSSIPACSDITRPVYLMVETLLCYTFIEYSYERDGDMVTWLLSGTIMRLALQQGYHHDPEQHAGLTVFESEMRRRVWIIVIQHEEPLPWIPTV
ncbi:hypothetical protein DID88_009502 [Monilinia fructigena]|uniref:Xylanolytic transcriptional activator regulatory domain-containing protein n=1 Tax=Monilinia fructigena TaxID=38457 RepID=A0A395IP72_9HELO|nr:hypothetical protein DID88_009502 [Monilinia fructigena]